MAAEKRAATLCLDDPFISGLKTFIFGSGEKVMHPDPKTWDSGMHPRGFALNSTPVPDMPKPGAEALKAELEKPGSFVCDAGVAAAVAKAAEKLESGEVLVKGYPVIAYNAQGKAQERLILLTDQAMVKMTYNYKKGMVEKYDRHSWEEIQQIAYGPFVKEMSIIPSMADFLMKGDIEKICGWRFYWRDPPKPGPEMFVPFLGDSFVDKVFRTYSIYIDDKIREEKGEEGAIEYMQKSTAEIALTCMGLIGWALWDSEEHMKKGGCVLTKAEKGIDYVANRGITAKIYNSMDMGMQDHTATPEEEEKKE